MGSIGASVKYTEGYATEYGYYNDTKKDKEYFKQLYEKQGYIDVTVKRTKSDTRGLKMYEIEYLMRRK